MTGRIFLFGDDIDTDQLAPGRYMRGGIEALAQHCLEDVRPGFAASVQPGDLIVAGENFGAGSSREQAAEALKHLGLRAVLARSFGGIFYRNAINLGLLALVIPDTAGIADGDRATLDADRGVLQLEQGRELVVEPLPENLRGLMADGGLVPHLKRRFAGATGSGP